MGAVLLLGKVADRSGHRFWLAILSASVACCMFLWVASAWWGVVPIIVYYPLNGLAGHTSSMLGTNYGLEIFPVKGRSGYFAVARVITGAVGATAAIMAGAFMQGMQRLEFQLWGATLNHYHVLFAITAAVTLSSVIPLILVGQRTVPEARARI
jgi:MFS family permease